MNILFIFCVILITFLIWVVMAFMFPAIGKVIKLWLESFKYITTIEEEKEENDE